MIVKTPSEPPPPVINKLFYEEPKDEDLRQLLSPPDLEDFDVPERLSNTSVTSVKKKKSKSGLKGKKKKKKGGKKKKTPTKETSTSPVESLFSYDPNAPDPIDMARQKVANRRRDNSELNSVMTTMKTFDDKMKNQPWLFGRMALSKQICRFWLPMDLRDLEGINPSQYLSQYCSVCKRRVKFYSQAFDRQLSRRKSKDTSPETKSTLDIKESEKAILDVHAGCINSEQLAYLCDLVCLSKKDGPQSVSRLNCKLFCSICALTERLFYSNFVTEDAIESDNSQRQRIEAADFDGLEWRLRNVKVTPELHRLLFLL
uniref:Uncharacterized protein LOC100186521 n=1 Tax=Phallusia mammillata TaxID=59560 RepID=A0A6F9DJ41_9ASCI|nr:uncharacterized protein LOC100186521 [Phallusia mammillata]